ncbi:unnamed protein product [Musa acuminata subsp. malaccensis]|uniref:(wild Malaysian banana) hypothetical protein n=1 Tax=Musa acuminata subsp. malaccensis TaxID=214687 RepID=A0A804IBX1_MUSAM|nr:PREDICTED: LOB domain-containing protein 29-like [Musa acuminata subsp. malaccensis]CAG1850119.1 unnamed protein product [Musa acuminata subsp. malaccensis]
MTGFGSPCGACKFLRRKCVRGCVFAPHFCNEQGAARFAAIHKVFGASNASKLLMHLPVSDRSEAAVTISYEAQARLQDPIYGCVAHIFALQRQVVNLQAQLVSLKAQSAQAFADGSLSQEDSLNHQLLDQLQLDREARMRHALVSDSPLSTERTMYHDNGLLDSSSSLLPSPHGVPHSYMGVDDGIFFGTDEDMENALVTQTVGRSSADHNMEDLRSVAFAHLRHV